MKQTILPSQTSDAFDLAYYTMRAYHRPMGHYAGSNEIFGLPIFANEILLQQHYMNLREFGQWANDNEVCTTCACPWNPIMGKCTCGNFAAAKEWENKVFPSFVAIAKYDYQDSLKIFTDIERRQMGDSEYATGCRTSKAMLEKIKADHQALFPALTRKQKISKFFSRLFGYLTPSYWKYRYHKPLDLVDTDDIEDRSIIEGYTIPTSIVRSDIRTVEGDSITYQPYATRLKPGKPRENNYVVVMPTTQVKTWAETHQGHTLAKPINLETAKHDSIKLAKWKKECSKEYSQRTLQPVATNTDERQG